MLAAWCPAGKRGEIAVNEYSQTSVPSIWAVGDVTDRINLTPVALMEGMAVAKTVALNQPTKPDYFAVASAVFSNPNIATVVSAEVGMTEHFGSSPQAPAVCYEVLQLTPSYRMTLGVGTASTTLVPVHLCPGCQYAHATPMHTPRFSLHTLQRRTCCVSLFLQGLTEEQAVQQYGDVDVYTSSFKPMRNTISGSPIRTFMKLVVDAKSDKVVGCHMVGDDSAEIMQVRQG